MAKELPKVKEAVEEALHFINADNILSKLHRWRHPFQEGKLSSQTVLREINSPDKEGNEYPDRLFVRLPTGIKSFVDFYRSSGAGGKKNVAAGKWYPYFGLGEMNGRPNKWLNKGTEEEINNYYGSKELKRLANLLDLKNQELEGLSNPHSSTFRDYIDQVLEGNLNLPYGGKNISRQLLERAAGFDKQVTAFNKDKLGSNRVPEEQDLKDFDGRGLLLKGRVVQRNLREDDPSKHLESILSDYSASDWDLNQDPVTGEWSIGKKNG